MEFKNQHQNLGVLQIGWVAFATPHVPRDLFFLILGQYLAFCFGNFDTHTHTHRGAHTHTDTKGHSGVAVNHSCSLRCTLADAQQAGLLPFSDQPLLASRKTQRHRLAGAGSFALCFCAIVELFLLDTDKLISCFELGLKHSELPDWC